ncbi:hypothetical protein [Ruegeria hyattellae]|uniref:hypothetical protein n=1 Tax=Ruegeria hyattellae TaxID=3233337 RepID=UPI00355C0210
MTALDFTKPAPSHAPSLLSRLLRNIRLAIVGAGGAVALILVISAVQSDTSQIGQYPASIQPKEGGEHASRLAVVIDMTGGFLGYGGGPD